MEPGATRILDRDDLAALLDPAALIASVERVFRRLGEETVEPSRMLEFHVPHGTFHVKATVADLGRSLFVAKVNGNFPGHALTRALATIQGLLVLADAHDGRPLAVMDSGEITAARTAAASAVAAKHLARRDAATLAVLGCGVQGLAHVRALGAVMALREVWAFDADGARAEAFVRALHRPDGPPVRRAETPAAAAERGDVVVTCTTATQAVLDAGDVRAGTFVAAVGADNPAKHEIAPALLARARVVVDDLEQCAHGGDLHHAIAAGVLTRGDVHATLGEVVAGRRPGRTDPAEVFVFDSTGIALEDVAAAALAYERAVAESRGLAVRFAS